MSGPVSPPLTVKEADGTPTGRPINTIVVSNGDLSITGSTATIDTSGAGGTAALTATQIGFGDSSNLLTGSSKLTWTDTAAAELLTVSGSNTSNQVRIINTANSASTAPDIKFYHDRGAGNAADGDYLAHIYFTGRNSADAETIYYQKYGRAKVVTDGSEDGEVYHNLMLGGTLRDYFRMQSVSGSGYIVFNEDAQNIDFRVESSGNQNMVKVDAGNDVVGIGGSPANDSNVLQVFGDAKLDRDGATGSLTRKFTLEGARFSEDTDFVQIIFQNYDGAEYEAAEIACRNNPDGVKDGQIIFRAADNDSMTSLMWIDGTAKAVGIGSIPQNGTRLQVEGISNFDPTTSTLADMDNTILIDGSAASAGDGAYGGAVAFTGVGSGRRRAAIAAVQTSSDSDEVGLSFFTHDATSPSSDETVSEHMRLDDNGRLFISDTDIGTTTASGRVHVRTSALSSVLQRWETTASPTAADFSVKLELEASGTPSVNSAGLGAIDFKGKDSGGADHTYVRMGVVMADKGAGTEDGILKFEVTDGGTDFVEHLSMGNGQVVVNEDSQNVDFRIESDSNVDMFKMDATNSQIGIGAAPTSGGAQFQVNEGATFYRETTNAYTANHDVTPEQAHGYVLVMESAGVSNTFTLPESAAIGMHAKFVNLASSAGMTIAVSGSSSHQINGAGSAGSSSVSTTTKFQTIELHYVATNVWVATEPAVAA